MRTYQLANLVSFLLLWMLAGCSSPQPIMPRPTPPALDAPIHLASPATPTVAATETPLPTDTVAPSPTAQPTPTPQPPTLPPPTPIPPTPLLPTETSVPTATPVPPTPIPPTPLPPPTEPPTPVPPPTEPPTLPPPTPIPPPPQVGVGLQAGLAPPDFTLSTLDGRTITLSQLRGSAVMINFWATWCPPCTYEMPGLVTYYNQYKEQGFVVLSIDITSKEASLADVQNFVNQYKMNFPILLDKDESVFALYQLQGLPTSFFINRQGVIWRVHHGWLNEGEARDVIGEFMRQ